VWTSGLVATDTYGNPVTTAGFTLGFNPAAGTNGSSVATLNMGAWKSVVSMKSYSSTADGSGKSPVFTVTGANGNNLKAPTTVTATATQTATSTVVLSTATCVLT
jgi:hypothetical protein